MSEEFVVYAMQHNVTKRIYVGSTTRTGRYQSHLTMLRRGKHKSKVMQADFDKFGEDYSLMILEKGISKVVKHPFKRNAVMVSNHIAEYKWMNLLKTTNDLFGYNSQDRMAIAYINQMKVER